MDQATIDAMRMEMDLMGKTVKRADSYGHDNVNTLDGVMPVSTLRAAVEGFQALVDEAAAKLERAEGGAVDQAALRTVLTR